MNTSLMILPVLLPALCGLAYATAGWNRRTRWLGCLAAAGVLLAGAALAIRLMEGTTDDSLEALGGQLRADSLSAFMLIVIGAIAVLATAASPSHLDVEISAGRASAQTTRRYGILVQAFIASMALAVLAADFGTLWVAVEATTIATTFLVGQRGTRIAIEAAWKYVLICSVGIALAFLGAVLLNFASDEAGIGAGLDWAALAAGAGELDPGVTRIAVALLVIGFGAKAGLAPLHAWLADAHGQAPAPVSALMSGVLLAVAFYAILRVKVIADVALGVEFARVLLVAMALASLIVAATLLIAQRDYKRMLAYSSMEHMGLLAMGAAAGSRLAMAAVLLHVLGHGLGKSVLFLGSGRILQMTGTSQIGGVRGLAVRQPVLATTFGLGVVALIGMPPFSLFASTVGIARAAFADGLGWAMLAALLLVLVIAATLLSHTSRMLLGSPADGAPMGDVPVGGAPAIPPDGPRSDDRATAVAVSAPAATLAPLVAGLVACAALGITLGPLQDLLHSAAAIVGTMP